MAHEIWYLMSCIADEHFFITHVALFQHPVMGYYLNGPYQP